MRKRLVMSLGAAIASAAVVTTFAIPALASGGTASTPPKPVPASHSVKGVPGPQSAAPGSDADGRTPSDSRPATPQSGSSPAAPGSDADGRTPVGPASSPVLLPRTPAEH